MRVKIQVGWLQEFQKKHPSKAIEQLIRYEREDKVVWYSIGDLNEKALADLDALAASKQGKNATGIVQRIKALRNLRKNPGAIIIKLEALAPAMKLFLKDNTNHWLFDVEGEFPLPMFIEGVHYHPRDKRNRTPAYVQMELRWMERGEQKSKTISWEYEDVIGGTSVPQLLEKAFLAAPNKEYLWDYDAEMKRYAQFRYQTGAQFVGEGQAEVIEGRWARGNVSLVQDGFACKLVMDDEDKEGQKSGDGDGIIVDGFWEADAPAVEGEDEEDKGEEEEDDARRRVSLPVHPYVKLFNLDKHYFMIAYISQLKPYAWDTSLADKLILPEEHKTAVQILMDTANEDMDDIIRGKSGGTICICTGVPGSGKTLTAEVTSETIKKPLYKVQCSQLGTDEEEIEKQLSVVLNRASRWKCLLLIDEADVYVRERGTDIHQNAIVGVFLRVLEYYPGILFLTSNLATVLDDAILSRATVHIKYVAPGRENLLKIWKVLAVQYKLDGMTPELIKKLVDAFPEIVGRDVKSLLKLAARFQRQLKCKTDLELFKRVAVLKDIE